MKFAVLGFPIKHSLSPIMHQASFNALGFEGTYEKMAVPPEELDAKLTELAADGFGGLNITIPLKEVALKLMDELDPSAELLGAVNTVIFKDGKRYGACTDGFGFQTAVEKNFDFDFSGKTVFFVGCGGAGRAAALTSAQAGATHIILSDMSTERTDPVAAEILAKFPETKVTCAIEETERIELAKTADLIVNATPIGMREDDPSPLPAEAFNANQAVYDMVYLYPQTSIMKPALAKGAKAANGLDMLATQGARSFEMWTGKSADLNAMQNALQSHFDNA